MNLEYIEKVLEEEYPKSHLLPKQVLEYMYVTCRASIRVIAVILNTSSAKVFHDMRVHNIPRRKPGEKGTEYKPLKLRTVYEWGYGKHPLLKRQLRLINGNGYVQLYLPEHPLADKNGYVYEHRLVAEEMLGRSLLSSEVVHHRDSNKQNNSPENLEVMTTNQHSALGFSLMSKFKAPKSSDPQLEQEWLRIAGEVYSVFCKKNSDYGPNNIAGLGIEGVVVRMFDKFMRLKTITFSNEQAVEDETIEDTVIDIIDYGIIYLLVKRGLWPKYQEPDFSEWEELQAFREMVDEEMMNQELDFKETSEKLEELKQQLKKALNKQVYDKDRFYPPYSNEGLEKLRVKMENGETKTDRSA